MTFRIVTDPAAWSGGRGTAGRGLRAAKNRAARPSAALPRQDPGAPGAAAVTALPAPPEPVRTPPRASAPRTEAGDPPHTDVKA